MTCEESRDSVIDEDLQASLLTYVRRSVFKWARRLQMSREDMDDAVQDVIVAVLRRSPERNAVPSLYVYSELLARNVCLRRISRNRRRRQEIENRALLGDLGTHPDGVDQAYDYVQVAQQLERALGSLPSVEQAVLILRYQNNCSRSEIAAQIGISESRVDRYLTRALSKLRAQVLTSKETCEPDPVPRANGTDGVG